MQSGRSGEVWDTRALRHSASELGVLAQVAREQGVDVDRHLRDCSISPDKMTDRTSLISFEQQLDFQRRLEQAGLASSWGVDVGTRLRLSSFGIAGYALLCADTFGRSLRLANHLPTLLNLKHSLALRIEGNSARLTFERGYPLDVLGACAWEWTEVAKVVTLFNDILGRAAGLVALRIAGGPPAEVLDALSSITCCQVVARAGSSEIEFPASLLQQPLPQREPRTFQVCVEICEQQVQHLRWLTRTAGRVRAHLEAAVGTMPTIESVSRSLFMSVRSLRRRLDEEGTSFQVLVEEVRRESAERLLATTTLSTEAIADTLGYRDVANFRHAFKRWSGETPRQYRDRKAGERRLATPVMNLFRTAAVSGEPRTTVGALAWKVQTAA